MSKNPTRLAAHFKAVEHKSLVAFITAGDPTLAHTVSGMHALVAGGVDVIELGVPFSDPEAEGPAIQASSERALANGVTLVQVLDMVREFRQTNTTTPIVLMGYLNSILAMQGFAARAGEAGVDGLIMVNLPPEAAEDLRGELAENGIDLIFLIAPTTTQARTSLILRQASGFVYYVSLKGTTGADLADVDAVGVRLEAIRQESTLPVCVGFGIKDGSMAARLGKHADGVVVGSALVNLMASHGEDPQASASALQDAAAELRHGLDSIA